MGGGGDHLNIENLKIYIFHYSQYTNTRLNAYCKINFTQDMAKNVFLGPNS